MIGIASKKSTIVDIQQKIQFESYQILVPKCHFLGSRTLILVIEGIFDLVQNKDIHFLMAEKIVASISKKSKT